MLDKLCRRVSKKAPCGAENGVESKLNLAKCASFTEVDTRAETVDKLMGELDGCDQVTYSQEVPCSVECSPAQEFVNDSDCTIHTALSNPQGILHNFEVELRLPKVNAPCSRIKNIS